MKQAQTRMLMVAIASVGLIAGGCAKKQAAAVPPAPPAPAANTTTPSGATSSPIRSSVATPARAATPEPRYPDAKTRARIDTLLARIEDAYFDYDKASLRPDALKALQGDSAELRDILKDYPDYKLTIEGHADERGSAEYNVALGDKRAESAKDYLTGVGIPAAQLNVVSYGKERPVCTDHDESCWQKNRRIHIVADAK